MTRDPHATDFGLGDATALVTGGAGFIGSHLAEDLANAGASVIVLDDFSAGHVDNLAGFADDIEIREGSVTDRDLVFELLDGVDVMFHLAANASVPRSVEQPVVDFESNVVGTHAILDAAGRRSVDSIVFASSAAVYGEPDYTPIDESHPLNPCSPYGGAKAAAEKLGFAYAETYGLPFTAARIFNSYGPRQRRYVMFDFLEKLSADGSKLEVLGSGQQRRDYCFVTDTVRALELLAVEGGTEPYNVAGESEITIARLAERMVELAAPGTEIEYGHETWEGDISKLAADSSKLAELGFTPTVGLKEGLEELDRWYRDEYTA